MFKIVFGMPGTGKTTYTRLQDHSLSLDFGPPRDQNQSKQIKEFTTELINKLRPDESKYIYIDSFPEYFDVIFLKREKIDEVIFLIPDEEDYDFIINRVKKRDGKHPFVKLYAKNFHKWLAGWHKDYETWKQALGVKKVRKYRYHNSGLVE